MSTNSSWVTVGKHLFLVCVKKCMEIFDRIVVFIICMNLFLVGLIVALAWFICWLFAWFKRCCPALNQSFQATSERSAVGSQVSKKELIDSWVMFATATHEAKKQKETSWIRATAWRLWWLLWLWLWWLLVVVVGRCPYSCCFGSRCCNFTVVRMFWLFIGSRPITNSYSGCTCSWHRPIFI